MQTNTVNGNNVQEVFESVVKGILYNRQNRKNDVEESEIREFYKWQETYGKIKEEQGIRKGKKEIIKELLKTMPSEEIAEKTNIELRKINKIAKEAN